MDNLERCARAIHAAAIRSGSSHGSWDDQPDIYRQRCRLYALAAVNTWQERRLWPRLRRRLAKPLAEVDRAVSRALADSFNAVRRVRH